MAKWMKIAYLSGKLLEATTFTSHPTKQPMKNTKFFFVTTLLFFLSACASSDVIYEGIKYPQTNDVQISFQENSIPDECSAFAHLLLNTKTNSNGGEIAHVMEKEAKSKGANLILIGMSREVMDEKLEADRFDYYGPEYGYTFNKTWLGWKFGFDEWNEGDRLVGFGANTWGDSSINYQHTLLVQAVFLRCGDGN